MCVFVSPAAPGRPPGGPDARSKSDGGFRRAIAADRQLADAIAPIPIALGEQVPNRVVFKNFMEAAAVHFALLDCTRLAGVSEFLTVSMLAHCCRIRRRSPGGPASGRGYFAGVIVSTWMVLVSSSSAPETFTFWPAKAPADLALAKV